MKNLQGQLSKYRKTKKQKQKKLQAQQKKNTCSYIT